MTTTSSRIFLSRRSGSHGGQWAVVLAAGLAVGILTSFGQGVLSGAGNAFVNSASAWLVVPLLVGTRFDEPRRAAAAGLLCCLAELVGYDLTSVARGFAVSLSTDAFWGLCAVVGGPLFGIAGRLWRHGAPARRGLGPAALAAAFVGEGIWTDLHELHRPVTAALWIGLGLAIAVAGLAPLGDRRNWCWPALTLPAGLMAEIALTQIVR
jgi:hypothetical protein